MINLDFQILTTMPLPKIRLAFQKRPRNLQAYPKKANKKISSQYLMTQHYKAVSLTYLRPL